MKVYSGVDLHSNNSVIALSDEEDRIIYRKRLPNDLGIILRSLEPFRDQIVGVVVESTYNWYWLVDGLMEAGYVVHLANPTAIKQYEGLKYTDDHSDAAWLAKLLRLKLLAEGYIYPKKDRAVRDLLRKRAQLVHQQTSNILSIQNLVSRNTGSGISANTIKRLTNEAVDVLLPIEDLALAVKANVNVLTCLREQTKQLERVIKERVKDKAPFTYLQTVDGIGLILSLTIMLETGDVRRFSGVGNFASYSRCVDSKKLSNGKRKGAGNKKCGNKYLAWAFVEAENFAIRYNKQINRYYQRKLARTNRIVAIKAVAHKLARASYYIMRDQVAFDVNKAFA
jgi:transposase